MHVFSGADEKEVELAELLTLPLDALGPAGGRFLPNSYLRRSQAARPGPQANDSPAPARAAQHPRRRPGICSTMPFDVSLTPPLPRR